MAYMQRMAYILAGLVCLGLTVAGCDGAQEQGDSSSGPPRSAISGPLPAKGDLLFVLRGQGNVAEGKPLPKIERRPAKASADTRDPAADARLEGVHDRIEVKADAVEWFTDRPQRKAGIAAAHDLVDRWKGYGFDEQPPNAAVTGPGTDAVVELRKPQKTAEGIAFESGATGASLSSEREVLEATLAAYGYFEP